MNNRIENTKNIVEIIAILFAGIWAVYVFIYQEHLAPLNAIPKASIYTEIESLGDVDGEIRQIKSFVLEDGTVEDFDEKNKIHISLRQKYNLGLIKSEARFVLPK